MQQYRRCNYGIPTVGAILFLSFATFMHWQIAVRSFALITELPDRVSKWFGADTGLREGEESNRAMAFFTNQTKAHVDKAGGAGILTTAARGKARGK